MITLTKALELVYGFTPVQAEKFVVEKQLDNEHQNPMLVLEELLTPEQRLKAYLTYDWFYCVNCLYYNVYHLESRLLRDLTCPCGGRMV